MDAFLIFSVVALLVLVLWVYPRVQEQRERDLVKRLEQSKDPTVAMIEVDTAMRRSQHEAGFFRTLMRMIWPS